MTPFLAVATDAGLPSLAVYGVAAFPISLLLWAVKWQQTQMAKKDEAIEKLNERLIAQSDLAIAQAERLSPLITDASRVLSQAIDELAPRYENRKR